MATGFSHHNFGDASDGVKFSGHLYELSKKQSPSNATDMLFWIIYEILWIYDNLELLSPKLVFFG